MQKKRVHNIYEVEMKLPKTESFEYPR